MCTSVIPVTQQGFHMTRHAHASVTLPEREDIVTLSHRLGHETPTIALEHYAHLMPKSGAKGAAAVNRLLTLAIAAGNRLTDPLTLKLPQHPSGRRTPTRNPQLVALRKMGGPSLPPRGSDRLRFLLRRTARTRLVDSPSVSNHSSGTDLSTYL